jgi:hypothetical protein
LAGPPVAPNARQKKYIMSSSIFAPAGISKHSIKVLF